MTCIVGLIENGKVYIGGDSASASEFYTIQRKDEKVFQINEFLIGATTSFRMIQILKYSFKPPEIKTKNLHQYMCTDFINKVRKTFKKNGYEKTYSDGEEKGGTFLVGLKGRLFEIDEDFQVGENLNSYSAIGCGYAYAYGSLYSTNNLKIPPKEKITQALEASEKFGVGVKNPFIIKSI